MRRAPEVLRRPQSHHPESPPRDRSQRPLLPDLRRRHDPLAGLDQCPLRRAAVRRRVRGLQGRQPPARGAAGETQARLARPQAGDGLDYVRGGLCKPEQFKPLPLSKSGANNDLNELFDRHLTVNSTVYAFGEPYAPPDRGVHDVHQNQGNIRRYADDNGVWQDGGLLVQTGTAWTAILLRFQSQSWRTDDVTGHARP